MSEMITNPFGVLTLIASPAILTNACAILQHGATTRYGLAISQWREFRASIAARDDQLSRHYADVDAALEIAQRRIRLLLRGLDCLYAAISFFGLGAALGLLGAILVVEGRQIPPIWLGVAVGASGLAMLLSAIFIFASENRCARGLLRLQLKLDDHTAGSHELQARHSS